MPLERRIDLEVAMLLSVRPHTWLAGWRVRDAPMYVPSQDPPQEIMNGAIVIDDENATIRRGETRFNLCFGVQHPLGVESAPGRVRFSWLLLLTFLTHVKR